MSSQPVQTVTSIFEKVKVTFSILVLVAGVIGFYFFSDQPNLIRGVVLVGALAISLLIILTTHLGKDFIIFANETIKETRKVVWPARKEAIQLTAVVFAFVTIMAIFLWGTDKFLGLILYDLILDWK